MEGELCVYLRSQRDVSSSVANSALSSLQCERMCVGFVWGLGGELWKMFCHPCFAHWRSFVLERSETP
eukprot:5083433-Amphidinium_carterae.1